jgi:hypothetical protein
MKNAQTSQNSLKTAIDRTLELRSSNLKAQGTNRTHHSQTEIGNYDCSSGCGCLFCS